MTMSIIKVFNCIYKNENVYVIMVKSIWQLLHVHITMQSYNLKSNKTGKQHPYHSTCTPLHAPLLLCIVTKYSTNHSSYLSCTFGYTHYTHTRIHARTCTHAHAHLITFLFMQ